MREFFHSWRRKVGCILLIAVVMLSIAWLRTWTLTDRLRFDVGTRVHEIGSRGGGMMWSTIDGKNGQVTWETIKAGPDATLHGYLDGWTDGLERFTPRYCYVMYFWVIWPLTLIAIHLIFCEPRPKVPNATVRPQPQNLIYEIVGLAGSMFSGAFVGSLANGNGMGYVSFVLLCAVLASVVWSRRRSGFLSNTGICVLIIILWWPLGLMMREKPRKRLGLAPSLTRVTHVAQRTFGRKEKKSCWIGCTPRNYCDTSIATRGSSQRDRPLTQIGKLQ